MTKNNRSNDIPSDTSEAADQNAWAARLDYFRRTVWTDHRAVHAGLVAALDECVAASGALESISEWRHADSPRSAAARTVVSDRAILVGLLLLSVEGAPMRITELADLFENRLDADSRHRLGLPDELVTDLSPARISARWLGSTSRAFHRLLAVMEPFPQTPFRPMSYSDISDVLASHDADREKTLKARLDDFTQSFLSMTFAAQPAAFTDPGRHIEIAIADHFIASGCKNGFNRRSLAARALDESSAEAPAIKRVVDVFAGWHSDPWASGRGPVLAPRSVKMLWGRTATLAVQVDRGTPSEHPAAALVVSATLRMPMRDADAAAVTVMHGAARTGLRPGIVHADLGYFESARVEKLHGPAYDLGFTPLPHYRRERLGVNGAGEGARWIEGRAYCSEMPALLVSASIDHREGSIDGATYRARLDARAGHTMRTLGKPTKNGTIRMICASIHHSDEPAGPNGDALENPSSAALQEACARGPVSLNWDDALRNRQAFAYRSPKWVEANGRAGRAMESVNAGLRRAAPQEPHGVLGFAAAQVFLTVNLTTYNLHAIARARMPRMTKSRRLGRS